MFSRPFCTTFLEFMVLWITKSNLVSLRDFRHPVITYKKQNSSLIFRENLSIKNPLKTTTWSGNKTNFNKNRSYIRCTPLIRSLPGNNTCKSTSWVTVWTFEITDIFNFIDPFHTQKHILNWFSVVFYT